MRIDQVEWTYNRWIAGFGHNYAKMKLFQIPKTRLNLSVRYDHLWLFLH